MLFIYITHRIRTISYLKEIELSNIYIYKSVTTIIIIMNVILAPLSNPTRGHIHYTSTSIEYICYIMNRYNVLHVSMHIYMYIYILIII
jgi:hypothetical protein